MRIEIMYNLACIDDNHRYRFVIRTMLILPVFTKTLSLERHENLHLNEIVFVCWFKMFICDPYLHYVLRRIC